MLSYQMWTFCSPSHRRLHVMWINMFVETIILNYLSKKFLCNMLMLSIYDRNSSTLLEFCGTINSDNFYIKYYIYIQKLFNKNHLDVHFCQMQLKHAIEREYVICNKTITLFKFEKFNFIYNNIWILYLSAYTILK